ncbi:DUF6221 family protein [Streptomyces bacillaris]|uniref:DUF6221 family protein n=1 Tax=Streptomyces bacillaris TaxID=68179 RepID=UPI0037F55A2A
MDDLVQFLRARYDEEHLLAIEAGDGSPARWLYAPELVWNGPDGPRKAVVHFMGSAKAFIAVVDPEHGEDGDWQGRHIARHDPARVLREVEAKRKIVDEYEQSRAMGKATAANYVAWANNESLPHPEADEGTAEKKKQESGLGRALCLLALPYADHTDYQDAWRP